MATMNGDEANCLLGKFVGGVDAGRGDEGEEAVKMVTKSLPQVVRLSRIRRGHDRVIGDVPSNARQGVANACFRRASVDPS